MSQLEGFGVVREVNESRSEVAVILFASSSEAKELALLAFSLETKLSNQCSLKDHFSNSN
jgi:hypothetical protein